ncbi:MAG TPA: hypothetical protein VF401_00110 [Candidatus Saccharimonadales bacterium]
MIKHNQDGAISGVVVSLVLTVLLLIGAVVFGVWAYSGKQDYKNNTDQKIAAAVVTAKQQEDAVKAKEYNELIKQPLASYKGSEAYGSLSILYPKTWSVYADESGKLADDVLVDGYMYPGAVPSISSETSVFATRFQVVNKPYTDVLGAFSDKQAAGDVTVKPYSLPKLPNINGSEVSGKLTDKKSGSVIIVPLRAQTVKIWTEGSQFNNDFNTYILPNFTFSP